MRQRIARQQCDSLAGHGLCNWDQRSHNFVKPEFESIRAQLLNHGAQDGNPLTLQQDPPEPGAVYDLFHNDLRAPHIRVKRGR